MCRTISSRCCSGAPRRRIWSATTPPSSRRWPREAWAFLAARKPGAPKIRFEQPTPPDGEHLKSISVIEIVNDDMPFLVDSVMGELTERGLDIAPGRASDPRGRRATRPASSPAPPARGAATSKDEPRESFIHVHVARIDDAARRAEIVQALEQVLAEVRRCVQDWRPMLAPRQRGRSQELKANPPPVPVDDIAEAIQFLRMAGRPTISPCSACATTRSTGKERDLKPVLESGLGVLRGGDVPVLHARRPGGHRSRRSFAPSSTSRRR